MIGLRDRGVLGPRAVSPCVGGVSGKKGGLGRFRVAFQVAALMAAVVTGYRFAAGRSLTSIETYCPFGGIETAWSLISRQHFTCATGELNLALSLALLLLTFLARKAFCGWVCPVGALSEWLFCLRLKVFAKARRDPLGASLHGMEPLRRVDRALRWLRLPVLVVILFVTYRSGELVFRGYDPYYCLFSFHGHGVQPWSYVLLAGIFLASLHFPMAWCRYLCPLGAALWPISSLGRLRLVRRASSCTGCRACDRACPQAIDISKVVDVRSGECTLCLACAEACPEPEALTLQARLMKP